MLVDWLVYGLLIWGLATALNKMAFKARPASKGAVWGLTILVFFLSVAALSVAKVIRYQVISDDVGVPVSPRNPLDMGGAFLFAWLFYSLLDRVKGGVNHTSSSEDGNLKSHMEALSVATESLSTATESKNATPDFFEPKRDTIDFRTVHNEDESDMDMEKQHLDQESPDFFQIAWDELSSGSIQKGIWARAYSETEGDEPKAKARYIKLRVPQLEMEHADTLARQREELARKYQEGRERRIREEQDRRIREEELSRLAEDAGKHGLLVCSVDSECNALGINPGDVIIFCNGIDVRNNKAQFLRQLESTNPSEQNILRLVRGKGFVDLTLRGGSLGLQISQLV
jgi:hypothetical protein